MGNLYLQCLECGLLKNETGQWEPAQIDPIQDNISHTYCPVCVKVLHEQIAVSKEFPEWSFQPQIQYLKKILKESHKKYDAFRLKHLLTDYFQMREGETSRYISAVQEYLSEAVCTYCIEEIAIDEHVLYLGPCKLHLKCFNELSDKMDLIQKNNWSKSEKIDAYLDMLEIQKELRPSLKKQLSEEEENPE